MATACVRHSSAATCLLFILVAALAGGGAHGLTEKLLIRENNELQLATIGPRPENGTLSRQVQLAVSQNLGMPKGLGSTGSLAFAASSDGGNVSYISVIDVSGTAPKVLLNKKLNVGAACALSDGVATYRLTEETYKVFVTATCICRSGVRQQQTVSVLSYTYTAASKSFSGPSKTQYRISTVTGCTFSDQRTVLQLRAVNSKLYALTTEGYCTATKYRLKQLTNVKVVDQGAGGTGDMGCVLSTGGIASGTSFVATCDPVVDGECGTGSPERLVRYSKYAKAKTVYMQPDTEDGDGPEIYSLAVTSDRTYYIETNFQADRFNGTTLKTLSKFGGAPIVSARATLIGSMVLVSSKTDGIMPNSTLS